MQRGGEENPFRVDDDKKGENVASGASASTSSTSSIGGGWLPNGRRVSGKQYLENSVYPTLTPALSALDQCRASFLIPHFVYASFSASGGGICRYVVAVFSHRCCLTGVSKSASLVSCRYLLCHSFVCLSQVRPIRRHF